MIGAIISYGTCLHVLFPGDPTGWILLRLLQEYHFLAHIKNPAHRTGLVTSLFNKTLNKNEARGTGKAPCDYEELRKVLKSLLRELGYSPEEPTREDMKGGAGGGGGGPGAKQIARMEKEIKDLRAEKEVGGRMGGGRGGGRGGRGGRSDPGGGRAKRENELGRPVWDRADAIDLAGNHVCVHYSLLKCKKMEEASCFYGGKKLLHKCSVVTSLEPLKLCLAPRGGSGGHEPGPACPHWIE